MFCAVSCAGVCGMRSCWARENRCFIAQAVTAGDAPWSPALDVNTGEAAVYAPMDVGFPADGVLASSDGRDGWTLADVDFDALQASRAHAQVANDRDWPQQSLPPLRAARVTALG